MRKSSKIVLALIILTFIIGIYFYSHFPDQVASHWNTKGEVDGYMSKFWGLFIAPFIMLGMWILFILIPKMDPLKENIEKFRKPRFPHPKFLILENQKLGNRKLEVGKLGKSEVGS